MMTIEVPQIHHLYEEILKDDEWDHTYGIVLWLWDRPYRLVATEVRSYAGNLTIPRFAYRFHSDGSGIHHVTIGHDLRDFDPWMQNRRRRFVLELNHVEHIGMQIEVQSSSMSYGSLRIDRIKCNRLEFRDDDENVKLVKEYFERCFNDVVSEEARAEEKDLLFS